MMFVNSTKPYRIKKIKNSITAPNESMHIHDEQHMSCNMSYNSIGENYKVMSLTQLTYSFNPVTGPEGCYVFFAK